MKQKRYSLLLAILLSVFINGYSQVAASIESSIEKTLASFRPQYLNIDEIKLNKIVVGKGNRLTIEMNDEFSYLPFREQLVKEMYDSVRSILPQNLKEKTLSIRAGGYEIGQLIPFADKQAKFATRCNSPIVTPVTRLYSPSKGLLNRHIALWQSHGYYFEQSLNRWEWQRARIFQTVEDLYTQSFVMPFLTPMLLNAGAYIFSPRERDTNRYELIADNDNAATYTETENERYNWKSGKQGFAHTSPVYTQSQNPFEGGTYRKTATTTDPAHTITARWSATIPQTGEYAVYIAYHSLKNSAEDALYTVCYKGGERQFKVNQTMGGGTWIYLGHFAFDAGQEARVELSNLSHENGKVITADAVKIGGGYGNIARRVNDSHIAENPEQLPISYSCTTSGYPRFAEAARYWLQWAGFPEKVYSPSRGENDYTDDYKCRGAWVNYLAGGSQVLPDSAGLNIPIDLALAFHSDAGTTKSDSIVGSLGIYFTGKERKTYHKNISRQVSRYLTDLILTQITDDIHRTYNPEWSRRGMWNKSYFEARVPEVPTMLLELLSHQNFADMRYGLDPRFRFLVSRAVYKGILKFIAEQNGYGYMVQPLPVSHMRTEFVGTNEIKLTWRPVEDPLEPTASPERYIVYTRINDGAFDNGRLLSDTTFSTRILSDSIYSFKITAVNRGGESFPSETLSLCRVSHEKDVVMVVNGFDRVSAPDSFEIDTLVAGFNTRKDFGVPYLRDICFTGEQYEFRREIPWLDDDNPGFGASRADYETQVIAGNTFDYPYTHGLSIVKAGYSFVSSSDEAVSEGLIALNYYRITDLILGKEKQVCTGNQSGRASFKTFPKALQKVLSDYCDEGRKLFVSGAYVATDLWDNGISSDSDKQFAHEILHYTWRTGQASATGRVKPADSPFAPFNTLTIEFHNTLNEECYAAESPDGIEPFGKGSYTIQRYADSNIGAGIFYRGDRYDTCILGYPFETIKAEVERNDLMRAILSAFDGNHKTALHPKR